MDFGFTGGLLRNADDLIEAFSSGRIGPFRHSTCVLAIGKPLPHLKHIDGAHRGGIALLLEDHQIGVLVKKDPHPVPSSRDDALAVFPQIARFDHTHCGMLANSFVVIKTFP